MRDVVVIGGGLTGLTACCQLEKLGLRYTVIELKRCFGGSIRSASENGFIMDSSAFAFTSFADEPWLPELGLSDQLLPLSAEAFIFRNGTESLVCALASELRGGRLMRMAVSSLGRHRRRFTICLENGLMLDAGALILAVPARYAVRMLYNLAPEAAEHLQSYRYEGVWRAALGFHKRDLPASLADTEFSYLWTTDQPGRVPDRNCLLIQLAMPAPPDTPPADIIRLVAGRLGATAIPVASLAVSSPEALSIHDRDHADNMRLIRALLPAGISLVGSDFLPQPPAQPGLAQLAQRMAAGRGAAHDAARFLSGRRST
ncbi:MAG: NAD(P)-binding protein [Chloroflexi bacterium]|nr:NAD(P)-binding protein [Chloroflexota bacterium]